MSFYKRLVVGSFFVCFVSAWPIAGSAIGHGSSLEIGVGPSLVESSSNHFPGLSGPFSRLQFSYGLSDFWSVSAGTEFLYDFGPPSRPIQSLYGGLRYNIDVFKYVPYLETAAGYFSNVPSRTSRNSGAFGLRLGLGLDQRLNRDWSVGAQIDSMAFPGHSEMALGESTTLTIRLSYHFYLSRL